MNLGELFVQIGAIGNSKEVKAFGEAVKKAGKAIDDYDNKSEASFEIFVNDIEPPDVFRTADGKEVLQYSNFNVMDAISYGDNVDPKPSVTIKGSVNTNVLGSYPLSATITDIVLLPAPAGPSIATLNIEILPDKSN